MNFEERFRNLINSLDVDESTKSSILFEQSKTGLTEDILLKTRAIIDGIEKSYDEEMVALEKELTELEAIIKSEKVRQSEEEKQKELEMARKALESL